MEVSCKNTPSRGPFHQYHHLHLIISIKWNLDLIHLKLSAPSREIIFFTSQPKWFFADERLNIKDSVRYLGTYIGQDGYRHAEYRISNSNKAYYALQGAGLHRNSLCPNTALHIFNTAVRSGLVYGCGSFSLGRCLTNDYSTSSCLYQRTIGRKNFITPNTSPSSGKYRLVKAHYHITSTCICVRGHFMKLFVEIHCKNN